MLQDSRRTIRSSSRVLRLIEESERFYRLRYEIELVERRLTKTFDV